MADSMMSDALSPSDPYARQAQTFPELTPEQVERAKAFGEVQTVSKGTMLFQRGERSVDFFIVLEGCVEIYEHQPEETHVITIHRQNQFTGELDLLNEREILVSGRMGEDGKVLRIPRQHFKRLMQAESDIGEIIMRAFILRRVGLISHEQGSVTLICIKESADSMRIERFLRRNGYPVQILDKAEDEQCQSLLKKHGLKDEDMPAVLIQPGEKIVSNPSNYRLAQALGLVEEPEINRVYDVAIVGAGPAGLSAAVYAASEGLSTLILESEAPGGQAGTSSKIENYLGFPTGISGQALAGRAQVQAQKFGAKIALPHTVQALDCASSPYRLTLCNGLQVEAQAVVIASGASYRRLDIADNRRFDNAGVYYAATAMEGELCKNEEIVIVGGGNSAGQAAVFLSTKAGHVHMLVRGEGLAETMSEYLIDRIESSEKITLHTHTSITKLHGEKHLEEVTWRNSKTGEEQTKPIRHVFLMIGAVPNTDWLKGCVKLDDKGFVCTGLEVATEGGWAEKRQPMMLETSLPGVFAAGDVRAGSIKRVASSVGEGSMSISHVHQYRALTA